MWLNFADDHLDRHPTVEAYAAAKARIFANQTADDWAVVNADDPAVMARSAAIAARAGDVLAVGRDRRGLRRRRRLDRQAHARPASSGSFRSSAVELTGRHMLQQRGGGGGGRRRSPACAPAAMTDALRGFRGLEHVMEPVGRDRRRAVRQRLEGDQRRGGAPVDRELRRAASWRSSAAGSRAATSRELREPLAARGRGGGRDRRGRAARARGADGVVPVVDAGVDARGGRARLRGGARPTAWCCWRRRARASTGSRTTRSADGCSRRRWRG